MSDFSAFEIFLIGGLAHVLVLVFAKGTIEENRALQTVSYKIAHNAYQNSGQYANERILKDGRNGGRGFCGEPSNIVDDAHKRRNGESGLEVAHLRNDERWQNHERESDCADLHGHKTENYCDCKHERNKTNALYFL